MSKIKSLVSNNNIRELEQINKYLSENNPFVYSLIANTFLDVKNSNLVFDIVFESQDDSDEFVSDILERLMVISTPNSSYLRSYIVDDVFLSTYNGLNLLNNNIKPSSPNEYKDKNVIVDIIKKNDTYVINFYRSIEQFARVIKISVNQ